MDAETKAALADVYEKAAEYLEEYGWARGTAGQHGIPRCFVGATASACGERLETEHTCDLWDMVTWTQANEWAEQTLEVVTITGWNDDPSRTKDEVINTLHALANKLR